MSDLFIIRNTKDLIESDKNINFAKAYIILIVSDVSEITNHLGRPLARTVIIGQESKSEHIKLDQVKKFMQDRKIQQIILIEKTNMLSGDIDKYIKKIGEHKINEVIEL
jgi:hypothetical protein